MICTASYQTVDITQSQASSPSLHSSLLTTYIHVYITAVSCIGVWRWMEIAALLSIDRNTSSRNKWRNFCCTSLFVTMFDVLVAASLVLALFSPLRWKLIRQCSYTRSNHVEYRVEVLCQCLQCLRDVVCMLIGSLCFLSFTGE